MTNSKPNDLKTLVAERDSLLRKLISVDKKIAKKLNKHPSKITIEEEPTVEEIIREFVRLSTEANADRPGHYGLREKILMVLEKAPDPLEPGEIQDKLVEYGEYTEGDKPSMGYISVKLTEMKKNGLVVKDKKKYFKLV